MHGPRGHSSPADSSTAIGQLGLNGAWLSANQCMCDLLGSPFEEFSRLPFDRLFEIEDPQQEKDFRARLLNRRIPQYSSKRKVHPPNTGASQVQVVFSLTPNGAGDVPSIFAVVEDLTALHSTQAALEESETARHELTRRLTNAQEKERTRIARELHDDIGQSLAILRIQMLRAGQPVSGMMGKRHPTITDLCNDLKLLAEKVSRISHQLHSSELEYLGLAVAIQSHCREFSVQYKIAVDCSCTNIPEDLDSLLALSLLRIVQEALHNAAKHSQAKSIQVAVKGSDTDLSLLIADDGVGFDLEGAKLAAGLGLISMRERIHLAHGQFEIVSAPGKGTRITARVPLEGTPRELAASAR
jgi:PAS domain S-box-containing protein